jgi:hypothetical protein
MRKNVRNGCGFQEEIPTPTIPPCAIPFWHAVMAAPKGNAKPGSTENEQT